MFLSQLELVQFKNHSNQTFEFKNPINVFIGANGIGKTNILDAIYFLSVFRSHIHHIDTQNIQHNTSFFRLKGIFAENYEVVVKYAQKSKSIEINQLKVVKYSDYFGHIPLVLSSPSDIFLLHDGSEERRKLLDYTISIYNKEYFLKLNQYNQFLEQRNAHLKHNEILDLDLIGYYNSKLVEFGNYIYTIRKEVIAELSVYIHHWYTVIAQKDEKMVVSYSSQLLEEDFKTLLNLNLEKDRILKRSTVGIHRDDLKIEMSNIDVKKIASQGQQKSILYALRIAQAEYISKKLQKKVLFLLDDFSDKLDHQRKSQLLQIIQSIDFVSQWFITDTNADAFDSQMVIYL